MTQRRPMLFYDSSEPRNIPSGVSAAVYVNGEFAWPEGDVHRMARVFRVSVFREAHWARSARCIDVETDAALPGDVPAFVQERRRLGYDDATVYVNRSNWQAVRDELQAAGVPEPLWWVATLDGTMTVPGAWAVQFRGGGTMPYDTSILHGVDNLGGS